MRRRDREIADPAKIDDLIMACDCCRLGFADKDEVYIVPLSFGYSRTSSGQIFYFHGASEGRKMNLIAKAGTVGFELDTRFALLQGPTACQYSAQYASVIGTGKVSLIKTPAQQKAALQALMAHYTGKRTWAFPEAQRASLCVFQLEVATLSCKAHL